MMMTWPSRYRQDSSFRASRGDRTLIQGSLEGRVRERSDEPATGDDGFG